MRAHVAAGTSEEISAANAMPPPNQQPAPGAPPLIMPLGPPPSPPLRPSVARALLRRPATAAVDIASAVHNPRTAAGGERGGRRQGSRHVALPLAADVLQRAAEEGQGALPPARERSARTRIWPVGNGLQAMRRQQRGRAAHGAALPSRRKRNALPQPCARTAPPPAPLTTMSVILPDPVAFPPTVALARAATSRSRTWETSCRFTTQ